MGTEVRARRRGWSGWVDGRSLSSPGYACESLGCVGPSRRVLGRGAPGWVRSSSGVEGHMGAVRAFQSLVGRRVYPSPECTSVGDGGVRTLAGLRRTDTVTLWIVSG